MSWVGCGACPSRREEAEREAEAGESPGEGRATTRVSLERAAEMMETAHETACAAIENVR